MKAKEWSLGCVNSRQAARGSLEAGFTQPRDHTFAQPCTVWRSKSILSNSSTAALPCDNRRPEDPEETSQWSVGAGPEDLPDRRKAAQGGCVSIVYPMINDQSALIVIHHWRRPSPCWWWAAVSTTPRAWRGRSRSRSSPTSTARASSPGSSSTGRSPSSTKRSPSYRYYMTFNASEVMLELHYNYIGGYTIHSLTRLTFPPPYFWQFDILRKKRHLKKLKFF